jgi:hypothetical protein
MHAEPLTKSTHFLYQSYTSPLATFPSVLFYKEELYNVTDARFNRAMLTFIQKCGATSKTAKDLHDFIMNAKKPSNLRFEDFKHNDLKNSMITYLTFQDLSINIWEMVNFL